MLGQIFPIDVEPTGPKLMNYCLTQGQDTARYLVPMYPPTTMGLAAHTTGKITKFGIRKVGEDVDPEFRIRVQLYRSNGS
jgi:hypothetical protein